MNDKTLQEITAWFRSTDLAELEYKNGTGGVSLRTGSAAPAQAQFPECPLVPVTSPAVGVFRWSAPGSPRTAEKGGEAAAGALLGVVEVGSGFEPVKAPCAGRLISVLIEEGKVVEYGQPLFFLQPH